MADFQGKFQYLTPDGAVVQQGTCHIHFDAQSLTLTPDSSSALAFDLGDLDAVSAADYEVLLKLYTGRSIVLQQLGKAFDPLTRDLTEAFRNRAVHAARRHERGCALQCNRRAAREHTGKCAGLGG